MHIQCLCLDVREFGQEIIDNIDKIRALEDEKHLDGVKKRNYFPGRKSRFFGIIKEKPSHSLTQSEAIEQAEINSEFNGFPKEWWKSTKYHTWYKIAKRMVMGANLGIQSNSPTVLLTSDEIDLIVWYFKIFPNAGTASGKFTWIKKYENRKNEIRLPSLRA